MRPLIPALVVLSAALLLGLVAVPGAVIGQDATAERSFDTGEPAPGETVNVTTTVDLDESAEVNFASEFDPAFVSAELVSVTIDGEEAPTLLEDTGSDGVLVVSEAVGPGTLAVTYAVDIPADAAAGDEYTFNTAVQVGEETVPVAGPSTLTVGGAGTASFAVSLDAPDSAVAGEALTVEYTVENTGEAAGTQDVVFGVDGTQTETVSTTLAAGETTTGSFEYTPTEDESELELSVGTDDESATTTVTVESPPDDDTESGGGDDDTDDGGDGSGPGFGLVGAVLGTALLTVYGLSRRRGRDR